MQVAPGRGVHRFQTGKGRLTAKRTNDVLRKPDNLKSYRHGRSEDRGQTTEDRYLPALSVLCPLSSDGIAPLAVCLAAPARAVVV